MVRLRRNSKTSESDTEHHSTWGFRRNSKTKLTECQQDTPTWSYWFNHNGPSTWGNLYSQARGLKQSPVAITEMKSVYDPFLANNGFEFDYQREPCFIMNDGAGWLIKFGELCSSSVTFRRPSDSYRLHEIRCHWGATDNSGAEHKLGDYEDVGEIQIIHYNKKYDSYNEAIQHKDGVTIFSVLLEKDAYDNPTFDCITELMNKIKYRNSSIPMSHGFDPKLLIPDRHDFWTYEGSLTTPPCSECVVWTVFRDALPISSRQLDAFRSIYAVRFEQIKKCQQKIINNVRPVQPLNGRMIRCSFRSGALCNYPWD